MTTISHYLSFQSSSAHYFPSVEQVSERFHKIDWDAASPWIQLAVITSAICGACILSKKGKLPREIPMVCCITALYFALSFMISSFALHKMGVFKENPLFENKPYVVELKKSKVWDSCVVTPIVEELFFRALVQRGLHIALSRAFPTTTVNVLDFKASFAAVTSTLIASSIFGWAHKGNHPDNPSHARIQVVTAGIRSMVLFGPLYHRHGILASSLSHVTSNTLVQILMRW